jgi:mono/diheme cytochrome c family protein
MKRLNLVAACLVLAACGPVTRADEVALLTGTAAAGRKVFEANCASCHGSDAKGTKSGVNLVEPAKTDPAAEFLGTVINGKGANMSSFAGLTDQQLADVYAYIKSK